MTTVPPIGYVGCGAYLPETVLTNEALEQIVDTSDEWIQRRTGIRTRRILGKDETILDMAVQAANRALTDAGIGAEEVDVIRVGVNTWLRFPSLASELQQRIGAVGASASDVSAGCAGFVYAVEEAYNNLLVSKLKHDRDLVALVVGVDGLSHITDWTDRNTCVLLGDGAGAVVIKAVDRGGILATHTHSQGQYAHLLYSGAVLDNQLSEDGNEFTHADHAPRPYLRMDGTKVYSVAIQSMVREIRTTVDSYNEISDQPIDLSEIDYVYPHQANLRIIEQVAEKLGVGLEKVYTDGIIKYGNTSTASIPIGYCDMREQSPAAARDRLEVDVAFGAGFACGAILRRECTPRHE